MFAGCLQTGVYFLLSKDSKWPKAADPDTWQFEKDVSEVRVLFIRHGESIWNDIFNKGFGPGFLLRVIGGLLREVSLLDTPDSVLVDSPLSRTGYKQSYDLARFVERVENSPTLENDLAILRGQTTGTIVVSSNLRRAIETITIGLWSRLKRGRDKVYIMSALQVSVPCSPCAAKASTKVVLHTNGRRCTHVGDLPQCRYHVLR